MMIESLVAMMRYLGARKDDDVADRMNYLFTPNILLALSVLISFKQFGGRYCFNLKVNILDLWNVCFQINFRVVGNR